MKLCLHIVIFLIHLNITGCYNAEWHATQGDSFLCSKYHGGFCGKFYVRGQGNPFQL